jgi:hypothetical protein
MPATWNAHGIIAQPAQVLDWVTLRHLQAAVTA